MANNSNPNVPGHVQSPLFTKLPLEIREQIYRVFFIGSRQEVGRHAYQSDPNNRYTKIVRNSMPRNKQFALAQACKAVYRESRHIYWSETAVTCAYMSMRANLNAIPFYARPLIRVLEGVAPVDDLVPTGQMDLVQFLGHFPNLEYCQLNRHTVHMYCHYDEIPPEGLLTKSGSDAFRAIAHMLDTNKPPVFVQRLFVLPEKDRNRVDWAYVNHTHSRLFITPRGSISDEEGFAKVTGPVEKTEKTTETNDPGAIHDGSEAPEEYRVHDTIMIDDAIDVGDGCEVYEDELEGLDSSSESEDESKVFQAEEKSWPQD